MVQYAGDKESQQSKDNVSSNRIEISTDQTTHSVPKAVVSSSDPDQVESLKYSSGFRPNDQVTTEKEDSVAQLSTLAAVESRSSQLALSKARTIALVVTLTGAAFLNTLSVQASIIILPTIGQELDIAPAGQQWIVSSYSLAFGCFLLL